MLKFAARSIAALALAGSPALAATPQVPDFWQTPTIHGYGKIHYLPDGAYKPRPDQTYKIVFSLTQASKSPDAVNAGLDHVARTVNLYAAAGVPLDHLKFVAVAYGAATPLALDNAQYRAAYKVDTRPCRSINAEGSSVCCSYRPICRRTLLSALYTAGDPASLFGGRQKLDRTRLTARRKQHR